MYVEQDIGSERGNREREAHLAAGRRASRVPQRDLLQLLLVLEERKPAGSLP